jgi:hypothetical protein
MIRSYEKRYNSVMFRNPVYDMFVVVPALLIAGLLSFFIMTSPAHAQEDGSILISRAQLPSEIATTTIDTALVTTTDDLRAYAVATVREDRYIASLRLSGDAITVRYHKPGHLLGVLPLAVPTTATVRANGSVSFTEPWYGAVTFAERDRMKSALEVRTHALLTGEGYLPSMSLSAHTQAEVLAIIRELLA